MMTDLQELYLAFERVNGKKLTKEPLYQLDATPILEGLTHAINQPTNKTLLTKTDLIAMKEHLERDNGLYRERRVKLLGVCGEARGR